MHCADDVLGVNGFSFLRFSFYHFNRDPLVNLFVKKMIYMGVQIPIIGVGGDIDVLILALLLIYACGGHVNL